MPNISESELQTKSLNELLRIALHKKNSNLKVKAIEILGSKKDQRVLSALIQIIVSRNDLNIRLQAVESLRNFSDLRGIDTLIMILKNNSQPPQIRALSASSIFSLDLRRGVEVGIDFLINTRNESYLIYSAILDRLVFYSSILKPKTVSKIKIELEELLDRSDFRDSWDLSITLAKTLTLYNSLMGIKFLLYQKKKLFEGFRKEYQHFIDSIEISLSDLKSYNSLSKNASDSELYRIIELRNP